MPKLSVVILMPGSFGMLRKTVRHLQAQTVRESIEVILVHAEGKNGEIERTAFDLFHSFQTVECSLPPSVASYLVVGNSKATSPILAYIEDHAFVAPDWAEKILFAYEGGWSCVAPAMVNGNPSTRASQVSFLMGFMPWYGARESSETDSGPGHNTTYRRDVLGKYQDHLEDLFHSERNLCYLLQADDHRIYHEIGAVTQHLNISDPQAGRRHSFFGGAVFGKHRSLGMTAPEKLFRTALAPLVPVVRLRRIFSCLSERGLMREAGLPFILPELLICLYSHAIGEVAGYWGWCRDPEQNYRNFELYRFDSLSPEDRPLLVENV